MIQYIHHFFRGVLKIELYGESIERFLNLCRNHDIPIRNISADDSGCTAYIGLQDFKKIKPFLKKSHMKVRIKERIGFPFFLLSFKKRMIFFPAMILSILLIFMCTEFIWKIDITGNRYYTDEILKEYLYATLHISCGTPKSKVNTEKLKSDIREAFPKITWISVSSKGTGIFIRIKEENNMTYTEAKNTDHAEDIVADQEGEIYSIVTREGLPLVKAGSKISKGDVLVSGILPLKDDSGNCTSVTLVHADADISVIRNMEYENFVPFREERREKTGKKTYAVYLSTERKRLTFHKKKDKAPKCRIVLHEYSFCIPLVPVKNIGFIVYEETVNKTRHHTYDECRDFLNTEFSFFYRNLEKKGVQILKNGVKIYKGENGLTARGTLKVIHSFGVPKPSAFPSEKNIIQY